MWTLSRWTSTRSPRTIIGTACYMIGHCTLNLRYLIVILRCPTAAVAICRHLWEWKERSKFIWFLPTYSIKEIIKLTIKVKINQWYNFCHNFEVFFSFKDNQCARYSTPTDKNNYHLLFLKKNPNFNYTWRLVSCDDIFSVETNWNLKNMPLRPPRNFISHFHTFQVSRLLKIMSHCSCKMKLIATIDDERSKTAHNFYQFWFIQDFIFLA